LTIARFPISASAAPVLAAAYPTELRIRARAAKADIPPLHELLVDLERSGGSFT
jgi:hypothetical protein